MPSESSPPAAEPWTREPAFAAVLAFLLPGAGHLYQGRLFKAVIYFVCITGIFYWGMHLGNWHTVSFRWDPQNRTYGYLSQVLVGVPALPALIQARRYARTRPPGPAGQPDPRSEILDRPLSTTFAGRISLVTPDGAREGEARGTINLRTEPGPLGPEVQGTFRGTFDGQPIELRLVEQLSIGPAIYALEDVTPRVLRGEEVEPRQFRSDRRYLYVNVADPAAPRQPIGQMEGTVPRPLRDWYQVPLEQPAVEHLYGVLGKRYELALVFTWIAGLLNILAIWDALDGPAYGWGSEQRRKKASGEADDESGSDAESKTVGGTASQTAAAGSQPPGKS